MKKVTASKEIEILQTTKGPQEREEGFTGLGFREPGTEKAFQFVSKGFTELSEKQEEEYVVINKNCWIMSPAGETEKERASLDILVNKKTKEFVIYEGTMTGAVQKVGIREMSKHRSQDYDVKCKVKLP